MAQFIYLLRHAEPDPWSPLGNDFSRPLNSSGKQHAGLLADWVSEHLEPPDTILCSPSKRTRETLAPILSKWSRLLSSTEYVESMYGASLNLLRTLAEDAFSYSERVLMVGHNPGVSLFLENLLPTNKAADMRLMATGTIAVVKFNNDFKREAQTGELLHLLERKDLSDH